MAETGRKLVVVTRPIQEARPLADRLGSLGYDVIVEPMLNIVPLPVQLPPLDLYGALIFTSVNGVRAFSAISIERGMATYAVGTATETELREAGFRDIRVGPGNAANLAHTVQAEPPALPRLLHVAGTAVAADFGPLLRTAGLQVDRIALYDANAATSLSPRLAEALYACTVSVVTLFSPRTARIFGTLVERQGLAEKCRFATAVCLSSAIAAETDWLPWRSVVVAARPHADAILDALPMM